MQVSQRVLHLLRQFDSYMLTSMSECVASNVTKQSLLANDVSNPAGSVMATKT